MPHKKAAKLFKIVTERKKRLRTGGPAAGSPPPKKKKAKIVKDEVDPDIQSSSGAERVGSAVL